MADEETARDDALLTALLAAETAVWEALRAGNAAADRAALADDFLGVTPGGMIGAQAHAAGLAGGPSVARYRLGEARAVALAPDLGLLAYRADYVLPGQRDERAMYVSSIWRRQQGGWRNVFSQDTPVSDTIVS